MRNFFITLLALCAAVAAQGATPMRLAPGRFAVPAQRGQLTAREAPPSRPAVGHRVASVQDRYVARFTSIASGIGDDGSSVTITPLGTDSIAMQGFWNPNITVRAAVNLQAGTISIPNQVVARGDTVTYDIGVIRYGAIPDRAASITGTIAADGTITINGWWAIFDNNDDFLGAYNGGTLQPANGTMTVTHTPGDGTGHTTEVWNVLVTQPGANVVTVQNFGNHGQSVDIRLASDSTLTVAHQLVNAGNTTTGGYYTYGADWSTQTLTSNITGRGTATTLTLGSLCFYSENSYYTGQLTGATITAPGLTFTYPAASATSWQGSGTEADPYQLSSVADLQLLATQVNTDSASNRSFAGVTFRVMNNIDAAGTQLDPIGNGNSHSFAGTLDGGGHTIANVNINTSTAGYAGLVGNAAQNSVIRNLTLTGVNVKSGSYFTGAVAGFSLGDIDNCAVTGTVASTGLGTGGVAGYAYNLTNCSFSGTVQGDGGFTGGVAGRVTGRATGCHATATVTTRPTTADYPAGGVFGQLYGPQSSARQCYFAGTLNAGQVTGISVYLGGVVGYNYQGTVDQCFNVGTIYADNNQAVVGGIVGNHVGTLTDCYNAGDVMNAPGVHTGGITGQVTDVQTLLATTPSVVARSFTVGRLLAETYLYDKATGMREVIGQVTAGSHPTLQNLWFDYQMDDKTSTQWRASTAQLTQGGGLEGLSSDVWTFTAGYYPRLKALASVPEAQLASSVIRLDTGFPDVATRVSSPINFNLLGGTTAVVMNGGTTSLTGHCGTLSNGVYTLNGEFGTDTICLVNPNDMRQMRYYVMQFTPKFLEGVGTAASPFLVKTKADLVKLSDVTTRLGQSYADTYFLMTNDIDLELDPAFGGISASDNDVTIHFAGHFDGGGHAIHHMKIDGIAWSTAPSATSLGDPDPMTSHSYKGFIGRLDAEGSVSNLVIAADCDLRFWAYSGAVVGYNFGRIENCVNHATVRGLSLAVGGIVGTVQTTGQVVGCLNTGTILCGYRNAGGIAGVTSGRLERCQNTGDVAMSELSDFMSLSRTSSAGGLAGSASGAQVVDCVNSGTVRVPSTAGGLAGTCTGSSSIVRSVNYGTLITDEASSTGGVFGSCEDDATLADTWFDAQVTGLRAVGGSSKRGVTSGLTSQLTSGKALANFADSVWLFTAGNYPVLKAFAADSTVAQARRIVVSMNAADVASNISHNATLSASASWRLASGDQFKLNGLELVVPQIAQGSVTDTLTATCGTVVKPIPLTAIPTLNLRGDGTQANPYVIATCADWNTAATYMNTAMTSYEGKWLSIVADLNFADTALVAMTGTTFDGTLLGGGHTLSGIALKASDANGGLIAVVGENATVSDLTLQGTSTSTANYVGSLAGTCSGTLSGIVNQMTVSTSGQYAGGIAGMLGARGVMRDCHNQGRVTASGGYAGGLAGQSGEDVQLVDCDNSATIAGGANQGGLVAYARQATFVRCANSGTVGNSSRMSAGGLVGYGANGRISFTDCSNTGTVTASASAGGLLGGMATTSNSTRPVIAIERCTNSGDISTTGNVNNTGTGGLLGCMPAGTTMHASSNSGSVSTSRGSNAGGLAGYAFGAATIVNCFNTGGVACSGSNAGGLAGRLTGVSVVDSCYNTGEVTANLGAAGLVASIGDSGTGITRSWNAGAVSTTRNGAGGLVAICGYPAQVSDCFNAGNVNAGTGFAGGLSGQSAITFTRCYNTGTITGARSIGGLGGIAQANVSNSPSLHFVDCYNAGCVQSADSLEWGNILGNHKYWDSYCGAQGTRFVTDFGVSEQDTIGTATTVAALAATTSDLAGNWTWGDAFTLPVLPGFLNGDCARAQAAAVALTGGDTYGRVTHSVRLGLPEGVTWTSDNSAVAISGDSLIVSQGFTGTVNLIATCGEFSRVWPVTFAITGGVSGPVADKAVAGRDYYTLTGIQVSQPVAGQVMIVVTRYTDGTRQATKVRY